MHAHTRAYTHTRTHTHTHTRIYTYKNKFVNICYFMHACMGILYAQVGIKIYIFNSVLRCQIEQIHRAWRIYAWIKFHSAYSCHLWMTEWTTCILRYLYYILYFRNTFQILQYRTNSISDIILWYNDAVRA